MADIHIIKETLDDMMRERCKTAEEYVYHTKQETIYLNNQIVWEHREGELIPQVSEKEALIFYDWYRISRKGQNRARDRKEREKTSPTMPSNFIGPARNPIY
ncbi:hypothetical protein Tco_1276737 [Tanacetum coccineum]